MSSGNWRLAPALGALVLAVATIPSAVAQCGLPGKVMKPMGWNPQMSGAHLLRASLAMGDDDDRDSPSIVGMWHVKFTASDGSAFDDSLVQWHDDGTEIMNSSRPAQDGNFCMGVWKRTGERKYVLNHLPWKGNDPTGQPQDGAQLIERVTLSPDGNSYVGTYTFVPYDQNGNAGPTFTGTISAKRVTLGTPFGDLL
ncbi:MAG TPA: hypothetical protein VMU48_04005 [Terracidiphilus sp.]|nr:hypothetical protein [Terracidiphilus sp.]